MQNQQIGTYCCQYIADGAMPLPSAKTRAGPISTPIYAADSHPRLMSPLSKDETGQGSSHGTVPIRLVGLVGGTMAAALLLLPPSYR